MLRASLTFALLGLIVLSGLTAQPARAQESSSPCAAISDEEVKRLTGSGATTYVPDISIPGFTAGTSVEINGSTIANYIRGIFIIFIWSVGVLAVVMVIYGGIKWVAAGGNPGLIGDAKDVITNAIIGLVIALTSFLVLRLINPEFTSFTPLSVNKVSRCSLALLKQILERTDSIPNKCSNQHVAGPPRQVCFTDPSTPCVDGSLSDLINGNTKFIRKGDGFRVDVDRVLVKALIMGEARLRGSDTVISGPTSGKACGDNTPRCNLKGTAYGIIQAVHSTLIEHWQKVEGSVPGACTGDESNWRDPSGSLKASCARILDNGKDGIALQIRIMSSILADVSKSLADKPTSLAAAYHLGEGGAQDFLAGKTSRHETADASVSYLRAFNNRYRQQCGSEAPVVPEPPQ